MTSHELLRLRLDETRTATSLRHVGRRAALLLGLDDIDATRVSTSISELGRLAESVERPDPVEVSLCIDRPAQPDQSARASLVIAFRYAGAAATVTERPDLHRSLRRLMDEVDLDGDLVRVRKELSGDVEPERLVAVRDELLRQSAVDNRALLQSLNSELVTTLTALREREAELVALNAELDQTNRGVVALYAELEHRSNEVRTAQRKVFEELADALRPPPPQVDGLEFDVRYMPAQANSPTGGDLYDWFVLPDGTVQVTLVDVRGHGVTGTRDALHVTHTVRALSLEGHRVEDVLARADRILQSGSVDVVATVVMLRVDVAAGVVRVAGAGHPPVLHVPAHGEAGYIEARGRALGYSGAGSFVVTEAPFATGDTMLLYSDGLTELRRDVLEGMETLRAAASDAGTRSVSELLDVVLDACAQGAAFVDDATVLAVRRPHSAPGQGISE